MAREISPERQVTYYLGMGLMVLGILLFLSAVFSSVSGMNGRRRPNIPPEILRQIGANVEDVEIGGSMGDRHRQMQSQTSRVIGGIILAGGGGFLMKVGARGLAGAGVILSPEDARGDLEPYTRMAGGMLKDALDEADINVGGTAAKEVIRIKCRECGGLNEEDARFCKACGKAL